MLAVSVPGVSTSAAPLDACAPAVAEVVSLQGAIEVQRRSLGAWQPAAMGDVICLGDSVRTGPLSRAALALVDESVLRLDQRTTLRLRAEQEREPSLIELLLGALHFFSQRPRTLGIGTPFVNAGAEGTEFLVRVSQDRAAIVMLEGVLRASNPLGELRVVAGQAAVAESGEPPRREIVVRARDAVAWTIYYPPIQVALAGGAAGPRDLPRELALAAQRVAANDYQGALGILEGVPEPGRDAGYSVFRAGVLLNVGRVREAREEIERAVAMAPGSGDALAQLAIIELAQDERAAALEHARRAVELSPESAPAWIALSYALQAHFELERARNALQQAVERSPEDALAWARLAEIELSLGRLEAAREAAARAAALAPALARTQMVLGFAELVRFDTAAARAAFEQAIAPESASPLPRLGLGLSMIRDGELAEGRRQIEIAANLDPTDALIRSYLGKAYFEEYRDADAAEQLQIAKELDPNDPTPWFYDAIRKQLDNRPVEALRDLERAIALNDDRAVYRSRLLLDDDLAARGARLGTIYRDLGFEQLALVEGWRSVNHDPSNYSAHRLLADTYSALPLHEIAQDSELLQAQLLQPLNIEPVQPRLAESQLELLGDAGPAGVGLNEYTRLFVANQASLSAHGVVGSHDTFADDLIVSGIYDNYSVSLGQSHFETEGFRPNNDLTEDVYNIFGQVQLRPDTSLLTEARLRDADSGDLSLRFWPDNFFAGQRVGTQEKVFRMGGRHSFAPGSTLIGSYAFSQADFSFAVPGFQSVREDQGHLVELRHILQWPWLNVTGGFGYFNGDEEEIDTFGTEQFIGESEISHNNAYLYSQLDLPRNVVLSVGVSIDDFEDPTADRTQVNPKLGIIWGVTPNTTLRAAVFRTLKRTLVSSQTIEPTQVAGFNQLFDDTNGTEAWRFGVGLDQKLTRGSFVGAEISRRELSIPVGVGPDFETAETLARAYGYWTPSDWFAVSAEYRYERRDDEDFGGAPGIQMTTHRVPVEVRFFHPSGLFARARTTFVDQSGRFEDVLTGELERGSDRFWVADAAIGYRFPNRWGLMALEVRNLLDEQFKFQDIDFDRIDQTTLPERTIFPERTVLGRLILRF